MAATRQILIEIKGSGGNFDAEIQRMTENNRNKKIHNIHERHKKDFAEHKKPTITQELLTVGETAKVLGLSPDSVRRLEKTGILKAIKVGKKGMRLFNAGEVSSLNEARKK